MPLANVASPALPAVLHRGEAVELAAALTASLCRERGLRCLFVKGPAAVAAGARPQRASADIDVLVHPEDMDRLLEALAERGWFTRPFEDGMGLPKHSVTAYHPHWPCDIDVHFRFPGLDADPAAAFAALERGSGTHRFAGVEAPVPPRGGLVLIQAVHALRNLHTDSHHMTNARADYDFLLGRGESAPVLPAWEELTPLLDGTGAWAAMEPFLRDAYPEQAAGVSFPAASEDWIRRTFSSYGSTHKLVLLARAPWREKPRILWRSLVPSREALAVVDLSLLGADRRTLARHRRQRLLRFLGRLPLAVRQARRQVLGR
ncbi:hypothetical protein GCM10023081_08790 [Arthrobacter ginkgonis]|uniref:Nucleotidyltransferase-like protein n=1 Tax=Arthrobacter ginkgonis TaxID=1630594 RepID=A0ABP7BXD7_9MICC